MEKFKATIYQLTDDGSWKFGGDILDMGNIIPITE